LSADLLIRGGRALNGAGLDVAVSEGAVTATGEALDVDAASQIDATGLLVLPGVVDPHVHFNEPGPRAQWEGWASGSAAAAAGGVSTVVEMPLNASPPTVDVAAFNAKHEVARRRSWVDFALWGGVVPGNLGSLEALAQCGVVGFKAFMSASGVEDFPACDDLTLYEAMRVIAPLGLPLAVHAESDRITAGLAQRARAQGRTGVRDYLDSRPAIAETEAIARAIELASGAGCPLHIVHVSTPRGVRLVSAARAAGVDVTCEVTPHHLILTDEDAEALGALAKCAPPLRPRPDTEALWQLLADGEVAFVGSDHSPSSQDLKVGDDAFAIWGGISGVQSMLELMLTEGRELLCAERLLDLLSAGAGMRLALTGKGSLAPGADADVTLVELGPARRLEAQELRYRHPYSAFVGRELTARVRCTIVRGEPVYRDGQLIGAPRGRLVRREGQ
jgi:allantoinase